MPQIQLKSSLKIFRDYYIELKGLRDSQQTNEGAVAPLFANLLRFCAGKAGWTLIEKYPKKHNGNQLYIDGALIDRFSIVHGYWEAKDSKDDLPTEIKKKFAAGYPRNNILFQSPDRAILWQNDTETLDLDISDPENLIRILEAFFNYQPADYERWEHAVEDFREKVPELGQALLELIEKEHKTNKTFTKAFADFMQLCRSAINPNLARQAVEEMLIQHLLTERIFGKVFDNPDFINKNIIAREIEKVINALTSKYFSRHEFLKSLDPFYRAIEQTALNISDYSEKQAFLNTVYEKFFQGFSIKVADTHGIVYTPQPVVNFMVNSVEAILQKEFGRSLSDRAVHILDPFVGTGNFIIRIIREIKKTALPYKYRHELHCNEVMLLPYYIAAMNIEHAYYEATGEYRPYDGICLVDTFELAEPGQQELFSTENTARVEKLKKTPIFVIIGNPPYNAGQVNENDNNKNRKYPIIDKRVRETYSKDSGATNKNALSDVYVKAIRWASDKIKQTGDGIVAFVSNNSFIDDYAFDGMRKHLEQDFDKLYILDLGGNVRKNPKLSGTTHNVFGIQVGVSINLLVKTKTKSKKATIHYCDVDKYWRKEQKYDFLENNSDFQNVNWRQIKPDSKHTWLTEGMSADWDSLMSLHTNQQSEKSIFSLVSNGVKTNRDVWAYNFDEDQLAQNIQTSIEFYNEHVRRWQGLHKKPSIDDFVKYVDTRISWSRDLKQDLKRGRAAEYNPAKIRETIYRPYIKEYLFFDRIINEEVYQFPKIFPTLESENENRVISLHGLGMSKPFHALLINIIPDVQFTPNGQCFPFYTYDEDGSNRRENISDWALAEFREHYGLPEIGKWDIFYYIYGLLHHPQYREKYQANLRRELPRIPFAPDFWGFAAAGKRLAELHVHYEDQPEYPLAMIEAEDRPLNWRVEKMKYNKDKTAIIYNDFLILDNIPTEVHEYRLGNRSALDWIVDQYRVKIDARSGIVNDPNRVDNPEYIVKLIKKIVTVSLETVKIVADLPVME